MKFYISNYDIYWTDHENGYKSRIAIAVMKGITRTCINLPPLLSVTCINFPPLLSVEATRVCTKIGNTEMFLEAVYKSAQRLWSDKTLQSSLSFRNKSILEDDLNLKYPVWNSKVSNTSGLKLLELFC
jgi:hypothetical protein